MRVTLAFGIFLIVVAAAILLFGLIPPTNEPIGEFLTDFVCESSEDANVISDSSTNQQLFYYCVDDDGNRREVSGWVIGGLTVLYLIPFLSGLGMTIYAANKLRQRKFDASIQELVDSGQLSPQSADILRGTRLGQLNPAVFAQAIAANSYGDLSSRLKQLDEALDKGLLSKDEYERAREDLLRNFTQS